MDSPSNQIEDLTYVDPRELVNLPDGDHSDLAKSLREKLKSYVFKGVHFENPAFLNQPGGFATVDYPETNYNFPCRDDDVFVVSYPKCGNTWTREVVTLIMHDPDVLREDKRNIEVRAPHLGFRWKGYEYVSYEEMMSPRIFKSHYPLHVLPKEAIEKKCKIVYVSRNFKDYAVSSFYFWRSVLSTDGNKARVVKTATVKDWLMENREATVVYWNYFSHTAAFWKHRNCGNILFIFYEDMIKDPFAVTRKIAQFLERPLTDEQLSKIVVETSFDKMKTNPMAHMDTVLSSSGFKSVDDVPFMRKGKVGGWKEHFNDEMNKVVDEFCSKYFQPIGLKHTYEW